ncbi:MAG: class I SAM-dependent methyltransferase [Tannerella sp.]|jgi:SAM-dependent methyltransferase|nr:class I SAM-dependent methyltransferase [Tannerella sp.]
MSLLRNLYYALSPSMRLIARRVWYFPSDCRSSITGKRDSMTPPKGMIYVGGGDFVEQGKTIQGLLVKYAGLKPESTVLDAGCGIGRLAVPLTKFLNEKGSYDGFDIVKKGIGWCNRRIATGYPNFKFLHVDLKNDLYNDKTETEACTFIFPYKDDSFDCVVLTSVFTHMMPDDVDNYIGQISRVMRPGGKCLATFFLVNDDILKRMEAGDTDLVFKHACGDCLLMNHRVKEANVAYREDFLQKLFDRHGLRKDVVFHGQWSNSSNYVSFQDVVVLSK